MKNTNHRSLLWRPSVTHITHEDFYLMPVPVWYPATRRALDTVRMPSCILISCNESSAYAGPYTSRPNLLPAYLDREKCV